MIKETMTMIITVLLEWRSSHREFICLWGLNVALNSLDSIVLVLACSSGTLIIRTGIGHWDPCYSLAPLLYLPRMLKSILIQTPWSNHAWKLKDYPCFSNSKYHSLHIYLGAMLQWWVFWKDSYHHITVIHQNSFLKGTFFSVTLDKFHHVREFIR